MALHYLQIKEGLRLGNKLTSKQIKWYENKMKVSLAAQTLSRSVSDSLKFCEMLKLKYFEKASDTCEPLEVFNHLFDVLNTKSIKDPGLKRALNLRNEEK